MMTVQKTSAPIAARTPADGRAVAEVGQQTDLRYLLPNGWRALIPVPEVPSEPDEPGEPDGEPEL